jgi:hypothetical protein
MISGGFQRKVVAVTDLRAGKTLAGGLAFLHLLDTNAAAAGPVVLLGVFRGAELYVGIGCDEGAAKGLDGV